MKLFVSTAAWVNFKPICNKIIFMVELLLFSGFSVYSQTNPWRDEKLRAENERKQILRSKVKEAVIYLFQYQTDSLKMDSAIIGHLYYDKLGYLSSLVNYRPSQYGPRVPPNTYTFTDLRDLNGNIIQHTMLNEWYTKTTTDKMIKIRVRANDYDNQTTTYEYDEHNNLVRDVDHFNSFIQYDNNRKERLGTGITLYTYDAHGNLQSKKSRDLDGKFNYANRYQYNDKNELVKILTWLDSASNAPTFRQLFSYRHIHEGLSKLESIYNNKGVLTEQDEFIFDRNGNQTKGYKIEDGIKQLVWDYSYDKANRVTESIGGPEMRFGPGFRDYTYKQSDKITEATGGPSNQYVAGSMDIRRDGLAHLFYSYDTDGNLTEIKKYERDDYGTEKLTMIQKIVYKRF